MDQNDISHIGLCIKLDCDHKPDFFSEFLDVKRHLLCQPIGLVELIDKLVD